MSVKLEMEELLERRNSYPKDKATQAVLAYYNDVDLSLGADDGEQGWKFYKANYLPKLTPVSVLIKKGVLNLSKREKKEVAKVLIDLGGKSSKSYAAAARYLK